MVRKNTQAMAVAVPYPTPLHMLSTMYRSSSLSAAVNESTIMYTTIGKISGAASGRVM